MRLIGFSVIFVLFSTFLWRDTEKQLGTKPTKISAALLLNAF